MTTLVPNSQASGVEAYEDMFKEITRKLYGEDASHSLQTPAAHITGATDAERSFTNLLSDRNLTSTDYDPGVGVDNVSSLKNDENLTAFGLALMQNGFPTPNAILNGHTFHQMNKQNQTNSSTSSSLINQTSTADNFISVQGQNIASNGTVPEKPAQHGGEMSAWKSENYQQSQKIFKNKKQEAPEISMNEINSTGSSIIRSNSQTLQKRYNCSTCPYSTDRRDLFTRHENIHKEDKPFHCYVCLKQFNRADHVKKHFLRMHRGLSYDIGRTKRSIPQPKPKKVNTPGVPYYNNTNAQATTNNISTNYLAPLQNQQLEQPSQTSIIDQTSQHLNSAYIAPSHQNQPPSLNVKVEKGIEKVTKKGDKRFVCCYCSWSGNDNWGLKRHLNTHTKPFVCVLCDYKAARSERLATHVFKVHNKKVCTKCNYLAENQSEYNTHLNEAHANEARSQRSGQTTHSSDVRPSTNNILRNVNNSFNGNSSFNSMQAATSNHGSSNWRTEMSGSVVSVSSTPKTNGNNCTNQKRGAERLFQYLEADDSDPEDYARQLQMAAISRNTASVAQDFHNAGGGKSKGAKYADKHITGHSKNQTNKCKENNTNNKVFDVTHHDQISIKRQKISPPANQKENSNYLR